MSNTQRSSGISSEIPIEGPQINDVYYGIKDAIEVAKEFPELEKGVLAILKEDYDITE
jgi:hypothetical protein